MRKNLARMIALLLTLCASVSVFGACGGDNGGNDGQSHTHTYSDEWKYDQNQHWHESTCGHSDAVQKSNHSFGEIVVDQEATPTKKGHGHKTCSVCGLSIYNVEVEYVVDPNADATLVFDVRGGEPIDPITVKAGTTIDLTQYTVTRTEDIDFEFEGWIVGGQKVESLKLVGDMVAHASYSCDDYLGKQTIQLGRYPQTRVTDQSIIDALDQMEFSDRNSNGYYEYQGEEYAKETCLFDSSFGYEKFTAYYFKVEPITWISSNGRWTTLRVIDFVDSYNLLEYLNGDFYDTLTDEEKAVIGDTTLNDPESYKFYLWNVNAFVASHSSQADRKLPLTDYALCKDETESYKQDKFTTKYWLLNPLNDSGIDNINFYNIDKSGDYSIDPTYMEEAGLLPCLSFDFQGVKKMKGDDTIRVTFNTNGGSEIASQVLIANEKYDLDTPEKEGYDFVGWYKDAELTKFVSVSNFSSSEDVELYAKWEVKPEEPDVYSVAYELNGGAFDSSITLDTEFIEGEVITFPNPKKDSTISYDYKFEGWYLEEDFQTKVTSTEGFAENVKVYAKWKEEAKYFYIEYNLDYGESIVETEYPTKVLCAEGTIDLPTAQRDGSIFLGWKERGHNEIITSLSTNRSSYSGAVELTPCWSRAYSITWNLDGGTLENQEDLPQVIYLNAPNIDFTDLVPQKDGYKFLYWSVSWKGNYGAGYEMILDFSDEYNLPTTTSDPIIKAVFSKVYTLKIDYMGGNVDGNTEPIDLDFGVTEGTITFKNPVKEGATLIGWAPNIYCTEEAQYSDLSGYHKYFKVNSDGTTTFSSREVVDRGSVMDAGTIFAIWDKITISFDTGIDGLERESIVINYKQNINLGDAIYALDDQEDKKFGGWCGMSYDREVIYNSSTYFCKDTVVYAKWLNRLTITIIYEDGTTDVQYLYQGDKYSALNFARIENQYKRTVYFDAELTSVVSSDTIKYKGPTTDLTLYVVREGL